MAALIQDTVVVLKHISEKFPTVSIIVVGHSMGGAVATKAVREVLDNSGKYPFAKQIRGSPYHLSSLRPLRNRRCGGLCHRRAQIHGRHH